MWNDKHTIWQELASPLHASRWNRFSTATGQHPSGWEGSGAPTRRAQPCVAMVSDSSSRIHSSLDLNACRNSSGEITACLVTQTAFVAAKGEMLLNILGLKEQRVDVRAEGCHLDDKYKNTFTAGKRRKKITLSIVVFWSPQGFCHYFNKAM